MNILVIEDEALVAKDLLTHLGELMPDARVMDPLSSVSASMKCSVKMHFRI